MRSEVDAANDREILDRRTLVEMGIHLPIQLSSLNFQTGRHPLGLAGDGLRFLRTRPYEPGQDNPRDIDKFSPRGEYWVNEWETERQASILLLVDSSASMEFEPRAPLRQLTVLQITYSLWRANDRVIANFFHRDANCWIRERNLRRQMECLAGQLRNVGGHRARDPLAVLETLSSRTSKHRPDLVFLLSDFGPGEREMDDRSDLFAWRAVIRQVSCDIIPVIVSFELPISRVGSIRFWDAERHSHRMTLLTPSRLRRLNEEERARVEGICLKFRQVGLDSLVARKESDVFAGLSKLARWRRKTRS